MDPQDSHLPQSQYGQNIQKQEQYSSDDDHGDHSTFITNPQEFLHYCLNHKKIKVMDECNPIMPNVYLKDISLHKKGPLEDKVYSKNDQFYHNIRRGNTLCQIYSQENATDLKEEALFMCRRGMKKFYDLEPEYLKVNRRLTHQHERYRHRIFEILDQECGVDNNLIHLYCLFKENGEHCQIAYVEEIGFWLFASKNVSILAREKKDLQLHYQKQRFYWAKLIGEEFFQILQNFSQEQKEEFKRDIKGKTLLGEHCGYDKHEHITKYDRIQIIFYGLVDNNGKDHCLPVRQCEAFLKKYNLRMSKMSYVEGLKEKNKVYENMYNMLKQTAEGPMDVFGEGSVMYMVVETSQKVQRTVGMCKLKTCEYLIFRKLREMIKIYFAKKGNTANSFEKYLFEIENLCSNYFKPPKQLVYYERIAEAAFKEVRKNQKDYSDAEFRYKFATFLDRVSLQKQDEERDNESADARHHKVLFITLPLLSQEFKQLEKYLKKQQFTIDYAYRQAPVKKGQKKTFHLLHMVPKLNPKEIKEEKLTILVCIPTQKYLKAVGEELEGTKDLKKSHLITFIKSQNKVKSLQLLKDKIENFWKMCIDNGLSQECYLVAEASKIPQILHSTKPQQHKQQENKANQMPEQTMHVVLTLMIPGSGKTALCEYIVGRNPEKNIQIVSSDKIRQKIMEKEKKTRKDDVSIEQLYQNTKKKGLDKYRQVVAKTLGDTVPAQSSIAFIDRVFCPTTIVENIQEMNRSWTKFIILIQKPVPTKYNDFAYPVSMKYLLACIKRSLEREDHETLSKKPNEIVRVLLKFYQMYRGFSYTLMSKKLSQLGIRHEVVPVELVREDEKGLTNVHLKKKVEEILKLITPGMQPPESDRYNELIELIYKFPDHIQPQKTEEEIQECLQECYQKISKVVEENLIE